MRYKSLLVLCSLILVICNDEAKATDQNNFINQQIGKDETTFTICEIVSDLANTKNLDSIIVKDKHIDIDNDGDFEELSWKSGNPYGFYNVIIDGKEYMPPKPKDALKTGEKNIKHNGKYYTLFESNGRLSEVYEYKKTDDKYRLRIKNQCSIKQYYTPDITEDDQICAEQSYNNMALIKCYQEKETALKEKIIKRLQHIYDNISSLSGKDAEVEMIDSIKAAQKSWESYVTNHCAYSYIDNARIHPPSQSLEIIRCRVGKTKERLNEINSDYRVQH